MEILVTWHENYKDMYSWQEKNCSLLFYILPLRRKFVNLLLMLGSQIVEFLYAAILVFNQSQLPHIQSQV